MVKDISTASNSQEPHSYQSPHRQIPPEFLQPKFWFGQLVERSYTDDETGKTYHSTDFVVGLTLNLPGWSLPG
jgi:hypothetical protein